ncbi:GDSL esterase/lipase At5g45960-like isoform X2 [Arachis stenosperma]|uniref:GDSL esterase/lipase At5g45960-like isoform X2 n=1 Tax=Arachis stenosperma TaxID=217475 RepID=UPI0025AD5778|nr:GDSL esterase/lipase At5g45960-like isoform X2 [Arachis stenosperma]
MVSSSSSAVFLIRSSSPCNPLLQPLATRFRFHGRRATRFSTPRNPLPRRLQPASRCRITRFPRFLSASYLGLKEFLPPYLDPNLTNQERISGVSFASDGSGYDTLTPTLSLSITLLSFFIYILFITCLKWL